MKVVPHKKGDFAGMVQIAFIGYCHSYFDKDGWHIEGTYEIVPEPTNQN